MYSPCVGCVLPVYLVASSIQTDTRAVLLAFFVISLSRPSRPSRAVASRLGSDPRAHCFVRGDGWEKEDTHPMLNVQYLRNDSGTPTRSKIRRSETHLLWDDVGERLGRSMVDGCGWGVKRLDVGEPGGCF
jgi:hypothetical protein